MKKHITTKRCLLVDFGNSCIKAGYFTNKQSHNITVDNKTSLSTLLKQSKMPKFDKAVVVTSVSSTKIHNFIKDLNKVCSNIVCVRKECFIKDIDFSNIDKKVIIGNDILLCAYYLIKNYKANALLCLGTVYFSIVTKGKKIVSVQLMPNISTGLKNISESTSIPSSLIPNKYDKDIGLNTPDAFASGAKDMIDGYINLLAKKHKLNPKQIIVSGGESDKYLSLSKKYTFIKYVTLDALAYLVKDKKL